MESVDLTNVPVVDNHCHGVTTDQAFGNVEAWRRAFTESTDPGMPREHVVTTALYRRLIRALAPFLGCEPTEDAVFAARTAREGKKFTAELLRSANIDTLLLDTGFPPPEKVFPVPELGELGGCRTEPVLRLEVLMESLLAGYDTLVATEEALTAALEDVRAGGHVALKSIAAYRTGLDIREWSREEAEASFREYRRSALNGFTRLVHKPLLDSLLHLRAVLGKPDYRALPVVLLHECYPYTRQGGYLAAVYENVYLDLSYGIPLLGYGEMLSFTRQAFGVAPTSKLVYSSDGIGVPELHWISALDGRRVLG